MIGNYTLVLITGASNQNLTSLSLHVVDNPFLFSLSDFLLGKGVGIAVGIIIPIVTIGYQMLSQRNQDVARQRDNKADWMMKNMIYYLTLSADSGLIYSEFEKGKKLAAQEPDHKNIDAENILINTIKFYRDYTEFGKNTGVYFFDDFRVEDFIAQLEARIIDLTSDMLEDKYTSLSQFYDVKSEADLNNNKEFRSYLQKVNSWLLKNDNSKKLFQCHYVYSWALQVAVNKALLMTYSPMSFSKKVKSRQLTPHRPILNKFIGELNESFYEKNETLYYKMFDSKRNLI
jgi:hypothetical protein